MTGTSPAFAGYGPRSWSAILIAATIVTGIVAHSRAVDARRQLEAHADELAGRLQMGINLERRELDLDREIETLRIQLDEVGTMYASDSADAQARLIALVAAPEVQATVAAGDSKRKEFHVEHALRITATGRREPLEAMLGSLLRSPLMVGIDRLVIEPGPDGSARATFEVVIPELVR